MLHENFDITHLTGYHIPATSRYFVSCTSRDDISDVLAACSVCIEQGLPILFLSSGTNMLIQFDIYPGLIIHNVSKGYVLQGDMLTVQSGHSIWGLASDLEENYSITKWHRFIGLPGSVAGAVYGNAGCFGLEVSNHFISCDCLDIETGEIISLQHDDMNFSYRFSCLKERRNLFCLDATFDLSLDHEKYSSNVDSVYFREHQQPKGLSCGSFFKNPSKEKTAGFLLEDVGMKGYKKGGAFFSEQHANFLMSDGTATHEDMMDLILEAKKRVFDKHSIQLENEVQIINTDSGILLSQK